LAKASRTKQKPPHRQKGGASLDELTKVQKLKLIQTQRTSLKADKKTETEPGNKFQNTNLSALGHNTQRTAGQE